MGTPGLVGFIRNGKAYVMYNHWGSTLDDVGLALLYEVYALLCKYSLDELRDLFDHVIIIDDKADAVSELDQMALEEYTDLSVQDKSKENWYCLTRKIQGSLRKILESGYLLLDQDICNKDELVDDYGYIYLLDFDEEVFSSNQIENPIELQADKIKNYCEMKFGDSMGKIERNMIQREEDHKKIYNMLQKFNQN